MTGWLEAQLVVRRVVKNRLVSCESVTEAMGEVEGGRGEDEV